MQYDYVIPKLIIPECSNKSHGLSKKAWGFLGDFELHPFGGSSTFGKVAKDGKVAQVDDAATTGAVGQIEDVLQDLRLRKREKKTGASHE